VRGRAEVRLEVGRLKGSAGAGRYCVEDQVHVLQSRPPGQGGTAASRASSQRFAAHIMGTRTRVLASAGQPARRSTSSWSAVARQMQAVPMISKCATYLSCS